MRPENFHCSPWVTLVFTASPSVLRAGLSPPTAAALSGLVHKEAVGGLVKELTQGLVPQHYYFEEEYFSCIDCQPHVWLHLQYLLTQEVQVLGSDPALSGCVMAQWLLYLPKT